MSQEDQQKRPRAASRPTARLLDLPPDVIACIASWAAPPDVLQLARTCHDMAALLLRSAASRVLWRSLLHRCTSAWRASLARLSEAHPHPPAGAGRREGPKWREWALGDLLQMPEQGRSDCTLRRAAQAEEEPAGASLGAAAAAGLVLMPSDCQRLAYVHTALSCTPVVGEVASSAVELKLAKGGPSELVPSRAGVFQHCGRMLVLARINWTAMVIREFDDTVGGVCTVAQGAEELVVVSWGSTLGCFKLARDDLSLEEQWTHSAEGTIIAVIAICEHWVFAVSAAGYAVIELSGRVVARHSWGTPDAAADIQNPGLRIAADCSHIVFSRHDLLWVDIMGDPWGVTPYVVVSRATWQVERTIQVKNYDGNRDCMLHAGLLVLSPKTEVERHEIACGISAYSLKTGALAWRVSSAVGSWKALCGHPSGSLLAHNSVCLMALDVL
eukprot:m51a1_g10933 hypothetical protein (443) ;mRNA; f:144087-145958